MEARRFAEDGRTIVLIGHAGHEEVVGTTGQAPERTILVGSPRRRGRSRSRTRRTSSYLTQTTLSVDETNEIVRHPPGAVPRDRGTAPRRHLLRHAEPTGRREGVAPQRGRGARDRLAELLELEPPGGALSGAGDARLPRRRRDDGRSRVAGGRDRRRAHLGRVGARVAGATRCWRGWRRRGSTTSRRSRSPRSTCASRSPPGCARGRSPDGVRPLGPGAELVAVFLGLLVRGTRPASWWR